MLAVLDASIEDVLHVVAPRVGDDRAIAERARAELHPALEPADDVACGDALGNRAEECVVLEPLRGEPRSTQRLRALLVGVLGPRVGVIHDESAWPAEYLVPNVVRRADGDPAVAGGRLDVEPCECGLGENATVRNCVERDAACEAEVA